MIDGNIQKYFSLTGVNRVCQFFKLFHGSGMGIELSERRLYGKVIQSGKRTSETAHAAIFSRDRVNGEKL